MRTLKKSLSLVLVLAMVCSFFVMGTSAAFEDAAEIDAKYAEAVEVMNTLKILQGSDGNFNPNGTLTRAQAARIIVAMLKAENLAKVAACTFTDVATTDWFYDEIAYCQSIGLMKGYGDGTVGPNDELTGPAFALMVMKAAGIDTSSVNPATFALDTIALAVTNEIATVEQLTAEPFTRELAAAVAFKGLNKGVEVVDGYAVYEDLATDVLVGYCDTYIEALALANTLTTDTKTYYADVTVSKHTEGSLAEAFKLAKVPYTSAEGLTGYVWAVDGEAITEPAFSDTLVASIPVGTTYKAIVANMGVTATFNKACSIINNGKVGTGWTTDNIKTYAVSGTTTTTAPAELYKTADGNFKLIYTFEYLAKVKTVGAVDALSKKGDVVFTVYGATDTDYTITNVPEKTYKAGDYYVVIPYANDVDGSVEAADSKFLSIEAPETLEGKVTGTGTGYIRVGTEKVPTGQHVEVIVDALDYNTSVFVFYLDSTGSIIGHVKKANAPVASTTEGYVYLLSAEAVVTLPGSSLLGDTAYSATAKAKVYFNGEAATKVIDLAVFAYDSNLDGVVDEAYFGKDENGTQLDADGEAETSSLPTEGWYAYETTDAGYVLTAVADSTGHADVTLVKDGAAIMSGKYADKDTVVTIYNYDSVAKNTTVTTYTGIAGYPAVSKTYEDASALVVVDFVKDTAGNATALIKTVDIYTCVDTETNTAVYGYYIGTGETYAAGQTYKAFYVNGERVEYKEVAGGVLEEAEGDPATLVAGTVYELTIDAQGKLAIAEEAIAAYDSEDDSTFEVPSYVGSTYAVIDDTVTYFGTGLAVYNVATAGACTADTIEAGDSIIYLTGTGANAGKIVLAYIVAEAE